MAYQFYDFDFTILQFLYFNSRFRFDDFSTMVFTILLFKLFDFMISGWWFPNSRFRFGSVLISRFLFCIFNFFKLTVMVTGFTISILRFCSLGIQIHDFDLKVFLLWFSQFCSSGFLIWRFFNYDFTVSICRYSISRFWFSGVSISRFQFCGSNFFQINDYGLPILLFLLHSFAV